MFLETLLGVWKGFIPALTILGVSNWISDPEHMEMYEKEFIETHKHEDECE